jgi:hypothetical protein
VVGVWASVDGDQDNMAVLLLTVALRDGWGWLEELVLGFGFGCGRVLYDFVI